MLILDNITCIRGSNVLFRDVGFCLSEGAMLLIRGANGSGKTSLLDIIAGDLAPSSGAVRWDGRAQDSLHIGHTSHIQEEKTAEENLKIWAAAYGSETLVGAAMHYYDLEENRNTPAQYLSAGMKRRLALSRLIVAPCKLWLLDEPTNFLDEEALLLTVSLIETRVNQGGIVIVATHIMNSAIPAHTLDLADFKVQHPI
jgi:heme exporter protein A